MIGGSIMAGEVRMVDEMDDNAVVADRLDRAVSGLACLLASTSLVGNSALVSRLFFPRLVLPLSSVGSPLVDFAVGAGVDEGQGVIDDVVDIVEINEQQSLRANTLNCQIDIADENVGTRIDSYQIRNPRVEIQLRGYAIHFEENSVDAKVRHVEHDVVLGKFVRSSSAARHLRAARNTTSRALRGQAINAQSAIERAQRISRLTLPWLSGSGARRRALC